MCSGKKKPRDEEEELTVFSDGIPLEDDLDCMPLHFQDQDDISVEDVIPSQEDYGVDCKCITPPLTLGKGIRSLLNTFVFINQQQVCCVNQRVIQTCSW